MRPRRPSHRQGGPPPRRTPPPASTGAEARYLEQLVRDGATVRLELRDDVRVTGKLTAHTVDSLQLEGPGGLRLVRKSDVRMIVEADRG